MYRSATWKYGPCISCLDRYLAKTNLVFDTVDINYQQFSTWGQIFPARIGTELLHWLEACHITPPIPEGNLTR